MCRNVYIWNLLRVLDRFALISMANMVGCRAVLSCCFAKCRREAATILRWATQNVQSELLAVDAALFDVQARYWSWWRRQPLVGARLHRQQHLDLGTSSDL